MTCQEGATIRVAADFESRRKYSGSKTAVVIGHEPVTLSFSIAYFIH